MLKSAKEVAKASQIVKRQILEEEQEKKLQENQRAEESAALDKVHAVFEQRATEAAKNGVTSIAIADLKLDKGRLERQGFLVKQLSRRDSFQSHLEGLCHQKITELYQLSGALVFECPGLRLLDGDGLLHRDPLFSLLESLWRKSDITAPVNSELALAYIRTMTGVDVLWLENNKSRFRQLAQIFSELKQAESTRNSVKWENSQIPAPYEQAIYVSWESSEDGKGLVLKFTSQKLKWFTEHWTKCIEAISELIDTASNEGSDTCRIGLKFGEDSWFLDPGFQDYIDICTPELLYQELVGNGYQVNFDIVKLDEVTFEVIERQPLSISGFSLHSKSGDYEMTIVWM